MLTFYTSPPILTTLVLGENKEMTFVKNQPFQLNYIFFLVLPRSWQWFQVFRLHSSHPKTCITASSPLSYTVCCKATEITPFVLKTLVPFFPYLLISFTNFLPEPGCVTIWLKLYGISYSEIKHRGENKTMSTIGWTVTELWWGSFSHERSSFSYWLGTGKGAWMS